MTRNIDFKITQSDIRLQKSNADIPYNVLVGIPHVQFFSAHNLYLLCVKLVTIFKSMNILYFV